MYRIDFDNVSERPQFLSNLVVSKRLGIETAVNHLYPINMKERCFDNFSYSSHRVVSLSPPEKSVIFRCSGKFSERRKLPFYCSFVRFGLCSSHFDREEITSLLHFPVIVESLAQRTMDFKAMYGDFRR